MNIIKGINQKISNPILKSITIILGTLIIFHIALLLVFIHNGKQLIYSESSDIPTYEVGIVFGAGVTPDKKPQDMLADRLYTTAKLHEDGIIKKIFVSGDNRFDHYNEPQVMKQYLIDNFDIPEEDIVADYAGRRTYDTCARAIEIWGMEKALLITQGYHLPRALYLCNNLGLESEGFSATRHNYIGEYYYKAREVFAIFKSIFDMKILAPDYVGGDHETDFDGVAW